MAATKKVNKDPEEIEDELEEELDDPPAAKKKETTKKEETPEWYQQLNQSIQELTNQLKPMKATKGTVEIPIPNKPKPKEEEEDPENNPQQQQQKKQSFLEWLM